MDQKRAKNGQKLVFFKYSRIIYLWKAYGKVITCVIKICGIFHFRPKLVQNGLKRDQKRTKKRQKCVFFKYSRVIYRWKAYGEVIKTFVNFFEIFHFQAQNGPQWPKKDQKWVKMGFLQI